MFNVEDCGVGLLVSMMCFVVVVCVLCVVVCCVFCFFKQKTAYEI